MQALRHFRQRVQALAVCLIGFVVWPAVPLAAQSHHFVYLSSATNQSISGFEISKASGAVTSLAGSPFPEGHDPDHLVFDPTGHFLYALNPNDQSVSGFAVDPVTGVLTELPASPFAVGGGAAPQFIAVEPSGKFLYVIGTLLDPFQGTFTQVSYYAIDAGGSLSSTAEDKSSPVPLSPVGIVSLPGDYRFSVAGTTPSNAISILTLELDPLTGKLNDTHFSPG